jgi:hypothetical protein
MTDRDWRARLDVGALAFPAAISVSDTDGERVLPRPYESPLRAAWAALHDACHEGTPLPCPADQVADGLAIAEAVLGPEQKCGREPGPGSGVGSRLTGVPVPVPGGALA